MTPYYLDISTAIQQTWHPPAAIQPTTTPDRTTDVINDILHDAASSAE